LIAGLVRGIGCEYHSTEVNPIYSHERFHEAHDLITRAWTEPGPFAFEGDHFNFGYVNTWPRCVQTPHPPIWIPSQGSGETIEWAAAPERKYPVIMAFSPVDAVIRFHETYRRQAETFGYEISGDQLGWSTPTYVAETDAIAERECAEHMEALFNNFFHIPPELLFPPGYTSIRSLQAILASRKGLADARVTFKDLMTRGNIIVGSAATVRERIESIHAKTGFRIMVPMTQFGTLPDDLVKKSTQMLAQEVAPHLRAL
jgi:alkanesulfonate monooxygenase SsuD/methylene tetrahydromethanopterin reductase-like flavin-dependent oxidoreductase (luciferase family)